MARNHRVDKLEKQKATLRNQLHEALEAVAAFEEYCTVYAKHEISPRLKTWQRHAQDALDSTI